uniref:WD_REPEATS_REGION domain-containing protein n=1 Tax=Ascaris lumbricoides TaxID=6252 RepID=A0A0M3I1W9_ASCLU
LFIGVPQYTYINRRTDKRGAGSEQNVIFSVNCGSRHCIRMSIVEFPPLGGKDQPYALYEMNGRIVYGSIEEVEAVSTSDMLFDYPKINKKHLQMLQHSMSREDVRRVFSENQWSRFQQALHIWQKNGTRGLLDFVVNISDGTRYGWPLASAGRLLKKAEQEMRDALKLSEENIHQLIGNTSTNLRWPFDAMVLAVACEDALIIWRLNPKALTNRPSAQCAQVLEVGASFSPITQCIWDLSLSSAIFIVSPSSSRFLVIDTATGESESIGGWTGAHVHRIWSSPDHAKMLVSYNSDTIKVYDRSCWQEEKWTGLAGGCVAAAWSPDCGYLLFACRDDSSIYSIRFTNSIELNAEGQHILRSYGVETPIEAYNVREVNYKDNGSEEMRRIGGCLNDMQLSPDGKRLAVSFKINPGVIALFISDWSPTVLLTPCALIEGASFCDAAIISFCPKFAAGSLLSVVWSMGRIQYIPLIYGRSARLYADSALFVSASDRLSSHEKSIEQLSPQDRSPLKASNEQYDSRTDTAKEDGEVQLFSTCGLYDQLVLNSALEDK